MSACFALGLDAGAPIRAAAAAQGVDPLFAGLPVILLVTTGGFVTNAAYCLYQNVRNHTAGEYLRVSRSTLVNNLLFCALAGVLWYSQFFRTGDGQEFPLRIARAHGLLVEHPHVAERPSRTFGAFCSRSGRDPAPARWRHSPRTCPVAFSIFFPSLFQ